MTALLQRAVTILKEGGLIGLPTETVYGLAGDARNETAIQKIFKAKGRPADHPVIVHIGTMKEAQKWAKDITAEAHLLMKHFWPGPLTLILHKQAEVSPLLSGGQDSIGLRMPNHPLALALLKEFRSGLAAPSANQFGHISPTCEQDVLEELNNHVDLILPGGPTEIGIESTIVDARTQPLKILRLGAITQEMLEAVLKQKILAPNPQKSSDLRVSGNLESHYAPYTPLMLLETSALERFAEQQKGKCVFLTYSHVSLPSETKVISLSPDPQRYAHDLYACLRRADHQKAELIVVEKPPKGGLWDAILDRLQRAAHKKLRNT